MQNCMVKRVLGLDFCALRRKLLQCGSDTVALLGRFLPRLGPLFVSGPFFCAGIFAGCRGAERG
jgi:hypothetical protein